jgi:hypothetical protein
MRFIETSPSKGVFKNQHGGEDEEMRTKTRLDHSLLSSFNPLAGLCKEQSEFHNGAQQTNGLLNN